MNCPILSKTNKNDAHERITKGDGHLLFLFFFENGKFTHQYTKRQRGKLGGILADDEGKNQFYAHAISINGVTRVVNNPLAHNNAIRLCMGETNVFRDNFFLFCTIILQFAKNTRQIKMKLTKKEALVEAPDFFFPLVPSQP
jgi:hypothetical protein